MQPFSSLRRTLIACVVAVASVVVAATGVVGNAGASTNLPCDAVVAYSSLNSGGQCELDVTGISQVDTVTFAYPVQSATVVVTGGSGQASAGHTAGSAEQIVATVDASSAPTVEISTGGSNRANCHDGSLVSGGPAASIAGPGGLAIVAGGGGGSGCSSDTGIGGNGGSAGDLAAGTLPLEADGQPGTPNTDLTGTVLSPTGGGGGGAVSAGGAGGDWANSIGGGNGASGFGWGPTDAGNDGGTGGRCDSMGGGGGAGYFGGGGGGCSGYDGTSGGGGGSSYLSGATYVSSTLVASTPDNQASVIFTFDPLSADFLTVSPIDFGTTAVGVPSTQVATLTNVGFTSLTYTGAIPSGADTSVTSGGTCVVGATLAVGASCTIAVQWDPTDVTSDPGSVTVYYNAIDYASQVFTLSGNVIAVGPLTTSGANFGNLAVGATASIRAKVINTGSDTATLTAFATQGDGTMTVVGSDCAVGTVLGPSQGCVVFLEWAPTSTVSSPGGLSVSYDGTPLAGGTQHGQEVLTVAGTVFGAGPITGSGTSFGSVLVGVAAATTATLTNTGNDQASITGLSLTGDGTGSITGGSCAVEVELAPGDSCTVELEWTPTSLHAAPGTIVVSYDGTPNGGVTQHSTDDVALSGTVAYPSATINGATSTFPFTAAGVTSRLSSTWINFGTGDGTITSLSVVGRWASVVGGSCAVGVVVHPTESCTVVLSWTPTTQDPSPGDVAMSWSDASGGGSSSTTYSEESTGAGPILFTHTALTPAAAGSSSVSDVVVANGGSTTLDLFSATVFFGAVTITGGTCVPGVTALAPGASCTLEMTYAPSESDLGTIAGVLGVLTEAGMDIGFLTTSAVPENLQPGPLTFSGATFGPTLIGFSSSTVLVATNSGPGSLTLSSVRGPGHGVTITGGTCVSGRQLASGASCALDLSWKPTTIGVLHGIVQFSYPGAGGSGFDGSGLTGTAIAPSVSGLSTSFGLNSSVLTSSQTLAIAKLARQIAAKGYTVVSLAGYTNPGERGKNTLILSTQRATNFAAALHTALVTLGDHNVVITAVGKGGTTKFGKVTAAGGSPKNRIVTYTLGN